MDHPEIKFTDSIGGKDSVPPNISELMINQSTAASPLGKHTGRLASSLPGIEAKEPLQILNQMAMDGRME